MRVVVAVASPCLAGLAAAVYLKAVQWTTGSAVAKFVRKAGGISRLCWRAAREKREGERARSLVFALVCLFVCFFFFFFFLGGWVWLFFFPFLFTGIILLLDCLAWRGLCCGAFRRRAAFVRSLAWGGSRELVITEGRERERAPSRALCSSWRR